MADEQIGGSLIEEIQSPATHLAYKAMVELRPNIGPELAFSDRVDTVQRPKGYRLVHFSRAV